LSDKLVAYKKLLKDYEYLAQLLRQIHSDLFSKYKLRSDLLLAGNVLFSAFITVLAVADISGFTDFLKIFNPNTNISLVNYIFSIFLIISGFVVLFISLGDLILNWRDRYLKHESGVKFLTDLIATIDEIDKLMKNDSLTDDQFISKVEEVKEKYLLICEMLPLTLDQDFLTSKQKYLIKRKISTQMDSDPCINVNLNNYIKSCNKDFINKK
jgi:hypothetical protein